MNKPETEHRNPVITPDKIEIDFSAVSTWLKCGKQYEFRYVNGKKSIPGIALLEGSAHHKAMEYNNRHKLAKGFDLKAKVVTEFFHEDLNVRVKKEEQIAWGEENVDTVSKRAATLHQDYFFSVAPTINPELIEHKFERDFMLDGLKIKLYGTIDLTEVEGLYDYKTCKSKWSQSDVDNDLQLSLYSLVKSKPSVGIIMFVKKSIPEVGIVKSTRSKGQILWALKVVKSIASAIQAGYYPLAEPSSWACNPKFCGYWKDCRGKYE